MVSCQAIVRALGDKFSNLDVIHFFPFNRPLWFQIGMLCVLYGLYTWRNHVRHYPNNRFNSKGLWRLIHDIGHQMRFKQMDTFCIRGSMGMG